MDRHRPVRLQRPSKRTAPLRSDGGALRLSKKSKDFSDSLKNAVTFPPFNGGKVLAALAERLAKQGIQGIRSHSRRAAAPSSSPAPT